MVYKKRINEMGVYQSSDGTLYDILESTKVVSPLGINVGWDEFDNIYEAAKAYKLTYIEPEPEQPQDTDSLNIMIQDILKEEVNS
mgnify:CR=1 FL=1